MMDLPRSPDYNKNAERHGHSVDCCVVCGRPTGEKGKMVHVWDGGYFVAESEVPNLNPAGDTGFLPIGPNCVKKYLTKEQAKMYVQNG